MEEKTLYRSKQVELLQSIYGYRDDMIIKDTIKFEQSVAITSFKDKKIIIIIKKFRVLVGKCTLEILLVELRLGK